MEINPETLEIEIVNVEPIDGGVQVFARAWSDGVQIGFGVDGTVDIERFRIFNPPILVEDASGTIIVEWQTTDDDGVITNHTRTLREDPEQALLTSLFDSIRVMKNLHGAENIIVGKTGNTTSTFYASFDGTIQNYNATAVTFLNKINDAAGTATDTTSATHYIRIRSTSSNQCRDVSRAFFNFDTSAIGSDTISSATQSFYGYTGTANTLGLQSGSEYIGITSATPASDTALTTDDYDQVSGAGSSSGTKLATDFNLGGTFSNWSTSGYNDFTYNSSGLAAIDKAGVTNTALRFVDDIEVTTPSASNSSDSNAFVYMYFVDQTGTTNDPKLVVEHAAAASTFTPRVMVY